MRVGGHLQSGVWQQEAADVGEAGVDVFPDVLQLLVLVLLHLDRDVNVQTGDKRFSISLIQRREEKIKVSDSRAAVSPGSFVLPPGRTNARRGNSSLGSGTSESKREAQQHFSC